MKFKNILAAGILGMASTAASAGVIDFVSVIEDPVNGLGESAWTSLSLTDASSGLNITLTGGYVDSLGNDNSAYVYLDWGNAGVGVCRDPSSGPKNIDQAYPGHPGNLCNPGNDDNVGAGADFTEYLDITFSDNAWIDFSLNSNHDGGFIVGDSFALFDGNQAWAASSSAINYGMSVSAGQTVRLMYGSQQFYLDTISVPEPAIFSLLGLGLLGFGFARRARKA